GQGLVYHVIQEAPKPVVVTQSVAALKSELLKQEPVEKLVAAIRGGNNQMKARAAYIAVCLGLYPEISKEHPTDWATAKQALSGYVKVMNNLFYGGNFKSLAVLQQKFIAAGFRAPAQRLTENDVYSDVVWVEPSLLY